MRSKICRALLFSRLTLPSGTQHLALGASTTLWRDCNVHRNDTVRLSYMFFLFWFGSMRHFSYGKSALWTLLSSFPAGQSAEFMGNRECPQIDANQKIFAESAFFDSAQ
jgi:hypothetical protein